jgi:hypothetical protein
MYKHCKILDQDSHVTRAKGKVIRDSGPMALVNGQLINLGVKVEGVDFANSEIIPSESWTSSSPLPALAKQKGSGTTLSNKSAKMCRIYEWVDTHATSCYQSRNFLLC